MKNNKLELSLGFSTCPNDTYIFEALVRQRLDTGGLSFIPSLADVEELNRQVLAGRLDVSKVSFGTYLHACNEYILLESGSALGHGVGPLLVCRDADAFRSIRQPRIAIPGVYTTANVLLGYAFPALKKKIPLLFSDIEDAVSAAEVDAGVIIHESRFTYAEKGLVCLADLGAIWEQGTGLAVPLGGIVGKRSLGRSKLMIISRLIRESLEQARSHPAAAWPYIKSLAQESADTVIHKHIDLYVNKFTTDLGLEGKQAVRAMFQYALESGLIDFFPEDLFLEPDYLI